MALNHYSLDRNAFPRYLSTLPTEKYPGCQSLLSHSRFLLTTFLRAVADHLGKLCLVLSLSRRTEPPFLHAQYWHSDIKSTDHFQPP